MEGLLRAGRPPLRRSDWTPEDCARFVAQRDVEFLAGLARNKAALRVARRLRLFNQPHSCSSAASAAVSMDAPPAPPVDSSGTAGLSPIHRQRPARRARPPRPDGPQPQSHPPTAAAAVVAGRDAPVAAPAPGMAGDSPSSPNARRRRSAARSARHHAARRLAMRSRIWVILFIFKLWRRVKLRGGAPMLMTPDGRAPDAKRDRATRSDDESSLGDYTESEASSEDAPVGPFASAMTWEASPATGSDCGPQSGPSTPYCSACAAPFLEESTDERATRHRRRLPHFCLECEALTRGVLPAAPAPSKPASRRRRKGRAGGRARVT